MRETLQFPINELNSGFHDERTCIDGSFLKVSDFAYIWFFNLKTDFNSLNALCNVITVNSISHSLWSYLKDSYTKDN